MVLCFVLIPFFQGLVFPAARLATDASYASLSYFRELLLLGLIVFLSSPRLVRSPQILSFNGAIVLRGLGLAALLLVFAFVLELFLPPLSPKAVPFVKPLAPASWIALFLTLGCAVLLEEFLYRVYIIGRLLRLGLPRIAAGAISVVLFAIGHWYQGLSGVFIALILGSVLSAVWISQKKYWVNVTGHLTYNVVVLILTFTHK